jgi:hypothetical protein
VLLEAINLFLSQQLLKRHLDGQTIRFSSSLKLNAPLTKWMQINELDSLQNIKHLPIIVDIMHQFWGTELRAVAAI